MICLRCRFFFLFFFFFMHKPAYELRFSYLSSDVCSSDLALAVVEERVPVGQPGRHQLAVLAGRGDGREVVEHGGEDAVRLVDDVGALGGGRGVGGPGELAHRVERLAAAVLGGDGERSEEHTSELQSLMRISYAVFCLKKNK